MTPTLPDLRPDGGPEDLLAKRLAAIDMLVAHLAERLSAVRPSAPTALEDYSLLHLAKATGTARSALLLMRAGAYIDAGILIRALFEQVFTYMWVAQDPARADARGKMVTFKQEWANAKYMEGLAIKARPGDEARLLAEAGAHRRVAEQMLAELAAELGVTEKQVRDEATKRASLKAIEVNMGPEFSVPYATYCGFVHSDGNALAAYGDREGPQRAYHPFGGVPAGVAFASDLHRALLRLSAETLSRCERLFGPAALAGLDDQAAWLAACDAIEASRA